MSKRLFGLLIIVAVVLAATGALWAAYGTGSEPMKGTQPMMESKSPEMMATPVKDFDRCTLTCNMLMDNYGKKFATMKAHEGDTQCWDTCWSRYGNPSMKMATAADKKSLWTDNRADRMRANQCSQACWRVHHDNENTVAVGGWRSAPRGVVCTP